jgi:hypothetical protein
VVAEVYSCSYNEFETTKIVSFNRLTDSVFERCSEERCDGGGYLLIYEDKDNLIFGNIILKEGKPSGGFQVVTIDKNMNLFTGARINSPRSNLKNGIVSGKCIVN